MPPALSEIERKILDYMVQYLRTNTYQPSIREIGERFGIKSTKTVSEHLSALAEKGYLERDPSRSRGVRILGVDLAPQTVSIPCFREIPEARNGAPELYLSLDRRIAGRKGSFFLHVQGEALSTLGVSDGDYLLVEPVAAETLESGDLVALRLDGKTSFCRYLEAAGSVSLQTAGTPGEPMVVETPETLDVVGKVTALYRRMDGLPTLPSPTTH